MPDRDSLPAPGLSAAPSVAFLSFNGADLSLGPVFGMHPNLRNTYPKGYYFIEGKAGVSVKGLPFRLTFRQSDEDLRFGRASYFRFSLDVQAFRQSRLSGLAVELGKLEKAIGLKEKELYALEAKWSYLNQKKLEYNAKFPVKPPSWKLPEDSLPDLPDTDLPSWDLPDLPEGSLPPLPDTSLSSGELPALSFPDSLQLSLENLGTSIQQATALLEDLKSKQLELQSAYTLMSKQLPTDFLSGIRKLDFGLTTLSKSALSKNALPIQGFHVRYAGARYFTDVAAGFTLPNQLFSNQAFDQLLYNSGNLFNISDYFQVNSVRLVSSAIAGWGREEGSYLAVENFYSGSTWSQLGGENGPADHVLTTNLSGKYIPVGWKNLTLRSSAGITWNAPGPVAGTETPGPEPSVADRIALYSSVELRFPRLRSSLESSYRRIPSGYDGWTQGIYLRQTERIEAGYRQDLFRFLKASLRFSRDLFFLGNAAGSSRITYQSTMDLQARVGRYASAFGSYSLLQLQDRQVEESPRSDLSQLGKAGLSYTRQLRRMEITAIHDLGYAEIRGLDSVQVLLQANANYRIRAGHWELGCQVQYSDFTGLTRLYGRNLVVQPGIGYQNEQLYVHLAIQQLWSEQFGSDYGLLLRSGMTFSRWVGCELLVQRFLPTEYALFIDPSSEYIKPVYLKFSVLIHLNPVP